MLSLIQLRKQPILILSGEIIMYKYDPKSSIADEFINDAEILESLAYASENKANKQVIDAILQKAREMKGISHKEAAVLLECELEEENKEIEKLAKEIKERFYGKRIVMFAPLYLSNYCINSCVYCPYHVKNKHIARKKLSQEEIKQEVIALQDMGHKRLAIEAGEDPENNPLEYILESIRTIYSIKHKNGAIRRVNVNIAATSVENYKKLKDAGIGTYILFQETYNKEAYKELHPAGPKSDYAYHTEAMDRAMEAGIDDVGCGVLFGLDKYRYELVGIIMHAEHLEAKFGVGPHTISVPRVCPADDIDPEELNAIPDEIFEKIVSVIRIAVPYTGMIVSTRESKATREKVLDLGISQISGGSRTSVGGYVEEEPEEQTIFEVVENMPDFPGGQAALMQYLAKNIKYPTIAQENGTQGRVIVQFVVNKDGSIVDAKVVRSVDPYLDKEALRVINTMPKWKPGMQRGKPVRVKFTVPVMFRLQ